MKTAFSYHRYSSELQRDSYTLETQRRITKEIAAKHSANIIQVYEDEAISGATIEKRPAMIELLNNLPRLKPDYLIVTDQDRLSRGNEFWVIKIQLAKIKASIITEKEGIIDQDNATIEAMSDMRATFAKLERADIGKRVSRGLAQKSKLGLWHTGVSPLGYNIVNSQLVKNPEKAILVRKIFDLAANGSSSAHIANLLNEEGYRTNYNKIFTHTSIIRILTNLSYIGKIKNFDEIYDGAHEPLIDDDLFEKVSRNIQSRSIKSKTRPMRYLLSGFLYCGKCGNKMYGLRRMSLNRKSNMHGYRCYYPFGDYCTLRITGNIDSYVMDLLKDKIKKLNLNLKKGLEKIKDVKNDKSYFQKDLEIIDSKISRLVGGYVDGIIPIEEYKKRNEELKNAKITLQKEIESHSNGPEDIYFYLQNNNVLKLFKDLDFYGQRALLDMFIYKIIVNPATTFNRQGYKDRIEINWKINT